MPSVAPRPWTWCLGSPLVMAGQMRHLIEVSKAGQRLARDHPRVHLRPALAHHGFHLYDADAVHVATMSATALLSDRDDVTTYAELFQRLLALAVFGDDARAVLDRLAETHRRNGAAG